MAKKKTIVDNVLVEYESHTWRLVSVSQLREAPWNYKGADAVMSEKLRANLGRSGQVQNLLVRQLGKGLYEVIDGNHRLPEMITLGIDTAVVCDLGDVPQAEAVRKAIELNETRFPTEQLELAERLLMLSEEYDVDELIRTIPYELTDFDHYQALTDYEWKEPELKKKKDEGEWYTFVARVPLEAQQVVENAVERTGIKVKGRVKSAHDHEVRNGLVLEALCAEYLAG